VILQSASLFPFHHGKQPAQRCAVRRGAASWILLQALKFLLEDAEPFSHRTVLLLRPGDADLFRTAVCGFLRSVSPLCPDANPDSSMLGDTILYLARRETRNPANKARINATPATASPAMSATGGFFLVLEVVWVAAAGMDVMGGEPELVTFMLTIEDRNPDQTPLLRTPNCDRHRSSYGQSINLTPRISAEQEHTWKRRNQKLHRYF
jgi:hypothetical protein